MIYLSFYIYDLNKVASRLLLSIGSETATQEMGLSPAIAVPSSAVQHE